MRNVIRKLMPKKERAIAYEQYVAKQLRSQGFCGVQLTPATGDFGADILCFDRLGNSCAVQCKLYSKPVGYHAVEETLAGARYYNCKRAILVSNNQFTKSASRGAQRLGVELFICFF